MHLTDLKLRALPFEDGQRDYADDAVSGLSVRVGKRSKTFMLLIRSGTSRTRLKLGQYPDLTLSQAREKARDRLAEARVKKEQPRSLTYESAFQQFKALHVPTMRPGSQHHCIRILTTRFTALRKRKLTDIKTTDLAEAFDAINSPSEKSNGYIWLQLFFNWCYRREYLVGRVVHSAGYNLLSLTRASAVVNCQFALACFLLRSASHASTSSFNTR